MKIYENLGICHNLGIYCYQFLFFSDIITRLEYKLFTLFWTKDSLDVIEIAVLFTVLYIDLGGKQVLFSHRPQITYDIIFI